MGQGMAWITAGVSRWGGIHIHRQTIYHHLCHIHALWHSIYTHTHVSGGSQEEPMVTLEDMLLCVMVGINQRVQFPKGKTGV